jgi:UDP-N-acetylglucosamine 3-dehydrogenase
VRVLNELDCCNLVGVADIDSKRARIIGDKYHIDYFSDYSKLIERKDVEFITVCTPTVTHAEIALEAIKAGKNVLIEKPMTNTVQEAKEIINSAKRQGVKIMVGFIERFNPAVIKTEELIKNREIGEIVLASSKRVSRRPHRIGDVGVIKDMAIHDIDLIRHLFGRKTKQVYAVAGNLSHNFEDYANIVIRFDDSRSAFVEANWLTPRKVRRLTITGTEGIIQVEYITQELNVEKQELMYMPFFKQQEPLMLELHYFLSSIINDEQPSPSGKDGLETLRICEAALNSAKTRRPINL